MIFEETPAQQQVRKRLRAPGEQWDAVRYGTPDPQWPEHTQLAWYRTAFTQLAGMAPPLYVRRAITTAQEEVGFPLPEMTDEAYAKLIGVEFPGGGDS
jgi:hypothetical protein